MTAVPLEEAQERLPELIAAAEAGEEVEIQGSTGLVIRLTPRRPRPPAAGIPKAGRLRGRLSVPDDFDAPLEELREYGE